MIGYASEAVLILGFIKTLTAAFPYFYGSPVGYLACLVLVGIILGLWILLCKLTQSTDEYGQTAQRGYSKTFLLVPAVLFVGVPVAVQWNTFATTAQTKHLECSVYQPMSRDQCFANWVKRNQVQSQAKSNKV